ncbi:hypothetical protein Ssi03_08280 [Sphaerisporangium siamense]|uniref:Uncharacterized protein n=2 Tax=Sphaerisporangium TaxID=321315 RepID=A0A7W8YZR2_9ACTN|nr:MULTISPECIES: hypothetical protein [Sphaerisporangium]MBB4705775.1 hypothetical protein [Sphaerisporangium siamense]MBB5624540.1 hypothetical protein [Sphaerisporangium krabiense]GII61504.1 hypothetical protein Skr01_15890 [Sphaerisporangium krabiense]GII82838.1 hypothetical protein Ssi03_08280 [Sphaerisporangium siamense]
MSEPQIDPAGNTQQFKAFAQRQEPEAAPPQRSYLVPAIVAVAAVIVIAVIVFLVVR